jgi:hypothetical protein
MSDLTILCVTKAEDYTIPFLEHFMDTAEALDCEYVFAIDDPDASRVKNALRALDGMWIPVNSKGFIESVLDEAVSSCKTPYIFRIDDDEKFSPSLIEWLKAGSYRSADHWKFPRVHLWGDTEHFINAAPLYPDHQTRLSTKEKSGGRHTVHAGSPFGGGNVCPYPIEHHKFVVKSRVERLAIAERYEGIQQGSGFSWMTPFNDPESFFSPPFPIEIYR